MRLAPMRGSAHGAESIVRCAEKGMKDQSQPRSALPACPPACLLSQVHASGTMHEGSEEGSKFGRHFSNLFDRNLTWPFLTWLKGATKLPVLVKVGLGGMGCRFFIASSMLAAWETSVWSACLLSLLGKRPQRGPSQPAEPGAAVAAGRLLQRTASWAAHQARCVPSR